MMMMMHFRAKYIGTQIKSALLLLLLLLLLKSDVLSATAVASWYLEFGALTRDGKKYLPVTVLDSCVVVA